MFVLEPPLTGLRRWVVASHGDEAGLRAAAAGVMLTFGHFDAPCHGAALKGGMLMSLRYASRRYTKDVDFSVEATPQDLPPAQIMAWMSVHLAAMMEVLDVGVDARIQAHELRPPGADRSFPTLHITVGWARLGSPDMNRLQRGQSARVLKVDLSYNERMLHLETVFRDEHAEIFAYAVEDLVAEKVRALIQQAQRGRERRQDVYDLSLLLARHHQHLYERGAAVLTSLRIKARSRGIDVAPDSLDEETRRRAAAHWLTLVHDVEDLPDFEDAWVRLVSWYRSLPWDEG